MKMVDGVMATYRTNFFMPNRWGLSLRVDPRLLMTEDELKVRNRRDTIYLEVLLNIASTLLRLRCRRRLRRALSCGGSSLAGSTAIVFLLLRCRCWCWWWC